MLAWALVVFGAAVVFGPDPLTRLVGLVIALIGLVNRQRCSAVVYTDAT